jgi:mannosyl-3-phosphoglycerate phosphatase
LRRTTPEAGGRPLAVITDLDGCLLDARDYSLGPARAAVRRLRRADIPLVLCTSKTRAEVVALFDEIGGPTMAVIEDGGGILVPRGIASDVPLRGARRTRDGRMIPLAPSYARVRRVLASCRRRFRLELVGFGDLDAAEIARLTGLSLADARRAARREFDEPLLATANERRAAATLRRCAASHGLTASRGGRFYHLHGRTDKGRATDIVRGILEARHGPVTVVALGDSPLDAPMLRAADLAVIIPRPDGRPQPGLRRRAPRARIAPAPGPAGWARAVTRVLAAHHHLPR